MNTVLLCKQMAESHTPYYWCAKLQASLFSLLIVTVRGKQEVCELRGSSIRLDEVLGNYIIICKFDDQMTACRRLRGDV